MQEYITIFLEFIYKYQINALVDFTADLVFVILAPIFLLVFMFKRFR